MQESLLTATQHIRTNVRYNKFMSIERATLLQDIHNVFVKRGYDGATLAHLSDATGLSKASLYHHFPGGKSEMAATLMRQCTSDLHRLAFSQLTVDAKPGDRLRAFTNGFFQYLKKSEGQCLLAVLTFHRAASDDLDPLHKDLAQQWQAWLADLSQTFEANGCKPKRARRQASNLVARLYGSLVITQLTLDDQHFKTAAKRLAKEFEFAPS